jgi:DNA-directed RNA polymerase I subunit RPA43
VTRAVKEKEMYNRDVQRLKDAGRWPDSSPDADAGGGEDGLIFPIGRIRKICKLDPDVKGISKESALLITKATELFCDKLGNECVVMAQMQNRRKLECKDVVEVCSSKESFMFLRSDMIDLRRAQQAETNQKGIDSGKERAVKAGEASLPRNNLDTYFGKIPH